MPIFVSYAHANESEADCLDKKMLEAVAAKPVVLGDTVLRQRLHDETQSGHERSDIAGFRTADIQPAPTDEATIQSLRHRQIITEENGEWRLKVPHMQQWLRTRG